MTRFLDYLTTSYHALLRQFTGAPPRYTFTWSERAAAVVITAALVLIGGAFVW